MPHVEIRPATAEEIPAVNLQASRQLGLPVEMFAGMPPDRTMCAFVDGEVATTYAAWPLQIRFNGPAARIAGVTQVSTHPTHRRRGYLRAVTRKHFEEMHERREEALAGLHPAWMAIYSRYGYGTVTSRVTYSIEPGQLRFRYPRDLPGRVREVDIETEFGLLVDLYRRYREDRNGLVHRGRAMWDAGPIGSPPAGHRQVLLAYEVDGEVQGYVAYHHGAGPARDRAGAGQVLVVTDYFALTPEAHQALWTILDGYDNVAEIRWPNAAIDDPLPNMLVEPRMLNARVRDGIMARFVTVEDALTQRPYPVASELTFDLVDDFCEWNHGRWRLETGPDGSAAHRHEGDADLRLRPDTLASLVFGQISTTDAARAGLVEDVRSPEVLDRWDATLRTKYRPHEAEHTW